MADSMIYLFITDFESPDQNDQKGLPDEDKEVVGKKPTPVQQGMNLKQVSLFGFSLQQTTQSFNAL